METHLPGRGGRLEKLGPIHTCERKVIAVLFGERVRMKAESPRGIEMTHREIVNLMEYQCGAFTAGETRAAQCSAFFFDASVQDNFAPLVAGGTLALVPEELRRDFRGLCQLLVDERVERIFVPVVALNELAHAVRQGAPLLGQETVVVATHGHHGTGLGGFDRRTGALHFEQAVCSSAASCLMVDGNVIVNSEGGELVAVSASDGATRYRHVFSSGADGDRPRKLEPVLRSGALFVPQSEVHVVRPHDGTLLGPPPVAPRARVSASARIPLPRHLVPGARDGGATRWAGYGAFRRARWTWTATRRARWTTSDRG